jgi:putative transposase
LKEDLAVLHLAGLSTRTLSLMSKRLLGIDISKDMVAPSLDLIADKAISWLTRPITDSYWALYVDGTNFNIQRRGTTEKEPSLVVLGIDEGGFRSILAIEPGSKENTESWRAVFASLKQRGLDATKVQIGVMDGLPGLEKTFLEAFPKAVTGRCWVHALKNAMAKTPARLRDAFKLLASKVMYSPSENDARKAFSILKESMNRDAQRAVQCLEKDLDSLLVHYKFENSYWRTLKTTNPIERVNRELKRRTKSMGTVGESTLEAVVAFTALRLEANWKTGKVNDKRFDNLKHMKKNPVELATSVLMH